MEDTRIACLKQVTFSVIVLGMLTFGSRAVSADSTGTGSISVVPGNGGARGIRLRSQTVDLVINEDASGAWADTDLRVQLYNRGTSQVVMPIGVPGPQISETGMPEIAEATLDGLPLGLIRTASPDRPEVQATATITVPVRGSVDLRIRYRQALTTQGGLVSYAYPLTAGNVWAGAPESLPRLHDLLTSAPAGAGAASRSGRTFAESRNLRVGMGGVKAPSNIGLAFMSSDWWKGLADDRAAAERPGPGSASTPHWASATGMWQHLRPPCLRRAPASTNGSPRRPLLSRRVGVATAQADTNPVELAAAHERLAGLYLAEGSREGGATGQAYLQLAVDELVEAAALNPGDAELHASVNALKRQLADAAVSHEGEMPESAQDAFFQQLNTGSAAEDAEARAQNEGLLFSQRAVAAGDFTDARQILTSTFGAEVLGLPDAKPPRISQAFVYVDNAPGQRTVRLQLVDSEHGAAASQVIAEAEAALRGFSDVIAGGTALTLTLPYSDPTDLLAWQDRLDALLPDLPELALLSSALSTRHLAWPVNEDIFTRTEGYQERVDLSKSTVAWEMEATKLEQAAEGAESRGQPLDLLRAAIWRDDARAWRDIGDRSRATYRAEVSSSDAGPGWLPVRVHRLLPRIYFTARLDRAGRRSSPAGGRRVDVALRSPCLLVGRGAVAGLDAISRSAGNFDAA